VGIEELKARIPERETRAFPVKCEVRGDSEGVGILVGHAAVFNTEADSGWGWREVIKPGAFTKTLREKADVRALINHDPNLVLGRSKSGTLTAGEDAAGLSIEAALPDTSYARDLSVVMRRGDVDQMSFAFRSVKENWVEERDKDPLRELLEVELYDVSVVTYPFYPTTDAQLRSVIERERAGKLTEREREVLAELRGVKPAEPVQVDHSDEAVPSPEPVQADHSRSMDQALRIARGKQWLTQRGNVR
jgi:hypothetical protein